MPDLVSDFVPNSDDNMRRVKASLDAGLCGCHRCFNDRGEAPWHMVVCPFCGNKRCPHASDHRLACTNSNAVGQKGSMYE